MAVRGCERQTLLAVISWCNKWDTNLTLEIDSDAVYIKVMKEQKKNFTLDELADLVDLPRRTVRYYIQIELIDKPEGRGRGAHYSQQHLEQLLEIRKWQKAGLSLERIRELLQAPEESKGQLPLPLLRRRGSLEIWSHLVVDEGVELVIDACRANLKLEQVRALADGVMALYENIRSKEES